MKTLKVLLWITGIACLLAFPFIYIPWTIVEKLFAASNISHLPNAPIVMYVFRILCCIIGLIGLFFVNLARNPQQYGPMLKLAAYGLLLFGLLSFVLGSTLGIPKIVYMGDAVAGVLLGSLILVHSPKFETSTRENETND